LVLVACASAPPDPAEARFEADIEAASEAFFAGDAEGAAALWEPWARKGRPDAQFGMGMVEEVRAGEDGDLDEALSWYRRAGEQGHSGANVRRGELLMAQGETGDAIAAYLHAAECGDARAKDILREEGVEFDPGARCLEPSPVWADNRGWPYHKYGNRPNRQNIRVTSSAEIRR
jgi:TPR repeat protein